MADTLISTAKVYVNGGGASGYGPVSAPTATNIARAQAAIDAMASFSSTDIDTQLAARVDIYFVPPSFFSDTTYHTAWSAGGSKPWGYSPSRAKKFINNTLNSLDTQYTVDHELGHSVAVDKLNHAKKVTLAGLMVPTVDTGVSGFWGAGGYLSRPSECFADTFPRVYAGITSPLTGSNYPGGWFYQHHVLSASYATFISTVGGAGAPAATTLAAEANIGATNIRVVSVTGLSIGDWIEIGNSGAGALEQRQLTFVGTTGSGGTGLSFIDALTAYHVNGSTVVETDPPSDPVSGTIDQTVTVNTANGANRSHQFTGLAIGTTGTAKMRFFDGTAWGPWSDDVAVDLSTVPIGWPTQLTVTPGTLTPDFGASLSGGLSIYGHEMRVYQDTTGGLVLKMHEGPTWITTATRVSIPYNGDPLSWGQAYKWMIWLTPSPADSDSSLWPHSDWQYFTPTLDVGPLITYAGNPVDLTNKIQSLTPTFRLTPRAGGNIDEAQLRIWNDSGTSLLWDAGVVSFTAAAYRDIAVPADILAWALNIRVSGFVRASGGTDLGAESNQYQAHVNAQPGAPYPTSLTNVGQQVIQRADGVWVTTDDTPTIVFPYRDTDAEAGYTDAATRREIELRNLADAHVGSSPYVITSGITDDWAVPTGILTLDTTFKARARYDDSASVRSAFSAYLSLLYSAAPVISAVTPADGATVTDPTPTFAWTYTSGKTQSGYRLVLKVGDVEAYSSGLVATADPTMVVPVGALDTAQAVDYVLSVYDSDGLYGSALGTFTTAFTVPDAITGLTLTVDEDALGLFIEWNQTGMPEAEFQYYLLEASINGEDFRTIATVTDPAAILYLYLGPAHNSETIIRISQSNGFASSATAQASETVGDDDPYTNDYIRGYWLKRPGLALELPWARHGTGDTQTDLESLDPPGHGEEILLDWGTTGYKTSIGISTTDRDVMRTLRSFKEEDLVSILATPYGAVRYVRLTSTPDDDHPAGWTAGWTAGQIAYTEVLSDPDRYGF